MPKAQVDLERKNTLLTEGVHTFKIMKGEEKEGGSGYPYWNFQLNCLDKGPDENLACWLMVSLSPQARWKLDQFLDAVEAARSGKASCDDFIGRTLRANIIWDNYNGSVKAKPDAVFPASGEIKTAAPAKAGAGVSEVKGVPAPAKPVKPPF